jgi:hypothetical protein
MLKAYSILYSLTLVLVVVYLFVIHLVKEVEIDGEGYIVITYCALTTISLLLYIRFPLNALFKHVNTVLVSTGAALAFYIIIEMLISCKFILAFFAVVLLFLLLCTALIRVLLKN